MNYNWGDPKKNSKLTALMMTKAEASRKKRLSSVKSTLSNQLHAGAESKLRKKKKSPESARREAADNDNNHHCDSVDVAPLKLAKTDDFAGPEESPASSSSPSSSPPIFEDFSLNAAAEGLFHPASTIEAFIEHDAKYKSKMKSKPSSGRSSLSSRSGSRSSTVGEYLPSLENQKLPVVLNEKGGSGSRRAKLEPDSPSRGSSRNQQSLASTRSDSDLHAPRRLGAVPSSADRNALDFYDHDDDGTDDDRSDDGDADAFRARSSPPDLGAFTLASSQALHKLASSKSAGTLASEDDSSLTKKFEDLKQLLNAKKKAAAPGQVHAKQQDERVRSTGKSREPKAAASDSKRGDADACRHATPVPVPVVVKTPPVKSKKDMKIRNGVSLSDLKEEHRAALEMLKELGGPMDADFDREDGGDERVAGRSKVARSSRPSKTTDVPSHVLLKASSTTLAGAKTTQRKGSSAGPQEQPGKQSPPASSPVGGAGGSLVAKLRASVPSGRAKTPELADVAADAASPRDPPAQQQLPASTPPPPAVSIALPAAVAAAATNATPSFALGRHERPLENVEEVDEEDDAEGDAVGTPETQQPAVDDELWRQYDEDAAADEDEDENEEEDVRVEGDASGGSATARSVDLYGDEGFESEW